VPYGKRFIESQKNVYLHNGLRMTKLINLPHPRQRKQC